MDGTGADISSLAADQPGTNPASVSEATSTEGSSTEASTTESASSAVEPTQQQQQAAISHVRDLVDDHGWEHEDLAVSVQYIGVDFEYRRQGIGRQLLDMVQDIAWQAGSVVAAIYVSCMMYVCPVDGTSCI